MGFFCQESFEAVTLEDGFRQYRCPFLFLLLCPYNGLFLNVIRIFPTNFLHVGIVRIGDIFLQECQKQGKNQRQNPE